MSVPSPASTPATQRKRTPARKSSRIAAAEALRKLLELATGQSSVTLELDSKGSVKPTVDAYHRNVHTAGVLAEAEFDRLMSKYHPKIAPAPVSTDAFSDADLGLLGLQRVPKAA